MKLPRAVQRRVAAGVQGERARRIALGLAALVGVASLLIATGWLLWPLSADAPQLPRTSLGSALMMLGSALTIGLLAVTGPRRQAAVRLAAAFPALVLATCAYLLVRHLVGIPNPGKLAGIGYGSVSPATALCAVSLAGSLLATAAGRPKLAALLCAPGVLLCQFTIVGFGLEASAIRSVLMFEAMAETTAIGLGILLFAGMLVGADKSWLVRLITSLSDAAILGQFVLVTFIVPTLMAAAVERLVEYKIIQMPVGFALLASGLSLVLLLSAISSAHRLTRIERVDARLATIVDSSNDAIISADLDGTIQTWNGGAERMFGYSAAEAVGSSIAMIVPEDLAGEERKFLATIAGGETISGIDTRRRRRDGSMIYVSSTFAPIRLASGKIVGASAIKRDISARRLMEEELRRSNAELEQFAYVASHDLQEPLRMVANYVELLDQRYKGQLDERADKYIHYASDGARRMQQLVTDLLAFSRVGSQGRPLEQVDLREPIDAALRALAGRIRDTAASVTVADMPIVLGDGGQLAQLFQNLVGNAIKFHGDTAPVVTVTATRAGQEWHLVVSDEGIGIEMRFAERVFQMFQRLHDRHSYEGSGIGLAISKRIVERHGGRIWIESDAASGVSPGTRVHFTLPAAVPA